MNLSGLKNPLVPLVILLLLLGINYARWETESKTDKVMYRVDKWAGQGWTTVFGNNPYERPVLDPEQLKATTNDVKMRSSFRNKLDINPDYLSASRNNSYWNNYNMASVEKSLAESQAIDELSEPIWNYRKVLTHIWGGLFGLSFLWLIFSLAGYKRNPSSNNP